MDLSSQDKQERFDEERVGNFRIGLEQDWQLRSVVTFLGSSTDEGIVTATDRIHEKYFANKGKDEPPYETVIDIREFTPEPEILACLIWHLLTRGIGFRIYSFATYPQNPNTQLHWKTVSFTEGLLLAIKSLEKGRKPTIADFTRLTEIIEENNPLRKASRIKHNL